MKHKSTGTLFDCRKSAIIIMGHYRYEKFLKQGEFEFIENNNKINKLNQ